MSSVEFYPHFTPLKLIHRKPVEDFLKENPPSISELTFTNLFMWRESNHYRIARYEEGFFIEGINNAIPFLLPPLVTKNFRKACRDGLRYLATKTSAPTIRRVEESQAKQLSSGAKEFAITEDRDNFDYVYSVKELTELRGEKFHDKKNLLRQFQQNAEYVYEEMTPAILDECSAYADEWCDERHCELYVGLTHENVALKELLKNFSPLSARGAVLRVKGKIIALTLGEQLNKDTFVIHIEKARTDISGAYQAINWEFLRHAAKDFKFVNREQDVGSPGLRKAKLSYNPIRMIKKYSIIPDGF